jgi:hypothetical protein
LQGCLSLAGWRVDDSILREALAIAFQYDLTWRGIASQAVLNRTSVKWGDLPADVGGNFNPGNKTITIATSLMGATTSELAAILAHEATHAAQVPARTAAQCLANEADAYANEARVWSLVPHSYGRSRLASTLDEVESAWRAHRLADYVAGQPLYQRECASANFRQFSLTSHNQLHQERILLTTKGVFDDHAID